MKLETSIKPRRDGVVLVTGDDGVKYTFAPDADGVLVCDIPHEPTVARLLALGMFVPADEADLAHADQLLSQTQEPEDGDDDGDDEDGEGDINALPVEANTPPTPKRRKKTAGESMATWDVWFPEVMPSAPTAPDPLVRQALCRAARQFMRRTKAWMEWLEAEQTQAGNGVEYEFALPAQTELLRVERATVNNRPFTITSYREWQRDWTQPGETERTLVTRDLVSFNLTGAFSANDTVQVTLLPARNAPGIPDHLANRYLAAIAEGAKSDILMRPGTDYYNPELAGRAALLFEQAMDEHGVDVYRGHTSAVPRANPKWC